jgi:hypothetical protein
MHKKSLNTHKKPLNRVPQQIPQEYTLKTGDGNTVWLTTVSFLDGQEWWTDIFSDNRRIYGLCLCCTPSWESFRFHSSCCVICALTNIGHSCFGWPTLWSLVTNVGQSCLMPVPSTTSGLRAGIRNSLVKILGVHVTCRRPGSRAMQGSSVPRPLDHIMELFSPREESERSCLSPPPPLVVWYYGDWIASWVTLLESWRIPKVKRILLRSTGLFARNINLH